MTGKQTRENHTFHFWSYRGQRYVTPSGVVVSRYVCTTEFVDGTKCGIELQRGSLTAC
jgi:hypothetical protein